MWEEPSWCWIQVFFGLIWAWAKQRHDFGSACSLSPRIPRTGLDVLRKSMSAQVLDGFSVCNRKWGEIKMMVEKGRNLVVDSWQSRSVGASHS
jgi:hypothetical protein